MNKKDAQQLAHIKQFIDENLNKNLTVSGICGRFIITRAKLQSHFQLLFNSSVYAYILRQKMEQAARRIVSTDDPIKIIALDSGYKKQRSFNKSFKSIFRDTPSTYRKKYQSLESAIDKSL